MKHIKVSFINIDDYVGIGKDRIWVDLCEFNTPTDLDGCKRVIESALVDCPECLAYKNWIKIPSGT